MTAIASNFLKNYIAPLATSHPVAVAAGCLCAIPTIDMAICALKDLDGLFHSPAPESENETEKIKRLELRGKMKTSMAVRGVGALILGACAANQFPSSGLAGLAGFLVYAKYKYRSEKDHPNPCNSIFLTGLALKILSHFKRRIVKYVCSKLLAAGACLMSIAVKVFHVGKAIIRGVGKLFHAVVIVPIKGIATVFKAVMKVPVLFFKALGPLVRHPILGLGVAAAFTCLIGSIKYGHLLEGSGKAIARLASQAGKGLFYTIPLHGVKLLGTALYFLPSVLIKTIKTVISIFNVILHPRSLFLKSPQKTSI